MNHSLRDLIRVVSAVGGTAYRKWVPVIPATTDIFRQGRDFLGPSAGLDTVRRAYLYMFEAAAAVVLVTSVWGGASGPGLVKGAVILTVLTATIWLCGYLIFLFSRSRAATPNLIGTLAAIAYGTGATMLIGICPLSLVQFGGTWVFVAAAMCGLGPCCCLMYITPYWIANVNGLASMKFIQRVCMRSLAISGLVFTLILIAIKSLAGW